MSNRSIKSRRRAAGGSAARGGTVSSRSEADDHSNPRPTWDFQPSRSPSAKVSMSANLTAQPLLSNTLLPSSSVGSFDFGRPVQFTGMLPVISRIFSSPPVFDEIFHLCQVPEPTMLARIARVCYAARNAVNEYLTRQWHRQLRSLFSGAHDCRALQARLGFLVGRYQQAAHIPLHLYEAHGGRTVTWTHSGLATIQLIISADSAHRNELCEWLDKQGYEISDKGPVNPRMLIDIHKSFAGVKGDFSHTASDESGLLPSTGSVAKKADHTVLILWTPSSGPTSGNLLVPLLCGSQILDVFSWRTCWTPYPRTKYDIPELHRDFCRSTEMAAERALKCVEERSTILREFFRARWLGDRASWVVTLSTGGLDDILARLDPTECDDSHWAMNGWTTFNGPGPDASVDGDFIRRGASAPTRGIAAPKFASYTAVDPRFRFPIPRWEYLGGVLDDYESSGTYKPLVEASPHGVQLLSLPAKSRFDKPYIVPLAFNSLVDSVTEATGRLELVDRSNDVVLRAWIATIQQRMQVTERELFLSLNAIVRESKPQSDPPVTAARRAAAPHRGPERRPRMHQVLAKLEKMKIAAREGSPTF